MVTSPVTIELLAALCIAASGVPGFLRRRGDALGQAVATTLNVVGSAAGLAGLVLNARADAVQPIVLGTLPVGRIGFALDGVSALFLVPILIVSALGSLYGGSYWPERQHGESGRRLRLAWGLMTAAMMAVVLAEDAIAFLVAWEVMALAAFFLISVEEERREVRRAAWIYLVATHAGTLFLVAFFALLGHAQGSFALWPRLPASVPGWLGTALFALGSLGFGFKAGLAPLHVWLPGAHANAPSHVSALLSGVLLKMGVYGLVRVCGLLPEPPVWWGGVLLGVGAATGILGITLATAQQDLKRLLAYSSIENIGIIAIGVGLASIGRSLDRSDLVALGLGGGLLHVLNHALMKPLLFFAAGGVLHAAGTRQISSLGGLAHAMPRTFALFVLGALAICGLPPLGGFASELLLYLGLLRTAAQGGAQGWAFASLAAPVLAMIGALAVASFVKVLGIAFSGTARSAAVAGAHDPPRGMLAPMLGLALGCMLLGFAPGAALGILGTAVAAWDPALAHAEPSLATLAPFGFVSAVGLAIVALVALLAALVRLRAAPRSVGVTWDCGYARPTARMQYVDASFSETLVGLFDWLVRSRPAQPELNGPFPRASQFRPLVPDVVLDRVVLPLLAAADRGAARLRILQRGPVQMYLLYVFLAVVILLWVAR